MPGSIDGLASVNLQNDSRIASRRGDQSDRVGTFDQIFDQAKKQAVQNLTQSDDDNPKPSKKSDNTKSTSQSKSDRTKSSDKARASRKSDSSAADASDESATDVGSSDCTTLSKPVNRTSRCRTI